MRKKLSWLRKSLGSIGKRIYWLFSKKMNLYLLSLMEKEVFLKYAEIHGDQKIALEILSEQFSEGASFILRDIFNLIKIFISESLEDLEYLANLAYYIVLGADYKEFFEIKFIPAAEGSDEIPKLVTKIKKCVCCASIDDEIHLNELGDSGYIHILFAAIITLLQMIFEYTSDQYLLEFKETKCHLRGDPQGELTVYIKAKDINS
jgi:hypothetical protein